MVNDSQSASDGTEFHGQFLFASKGTCFFALYVAVYVWQQQGPVEEFKTGSAAAFDGV